MIRTAILDRTQWRQEAYAVKNISTQGFRGLRNAFLLAATVAVSGANAQPTFSKVFTPSAIGPGSVSTITFTLTNGTGSPVTGLGFTDVLPTTPGAVVIATPANASTTCDEGVVTAPPGGGTISFSDGRLGTGETCTVTVDVTASTAGTHTNTSGGLTSTPAGGAPPTATADLIVVTTLPGFSKGFAPSSVPLGGRSTLTFTIDNSLNGSFALFLAFTDNLPAGMEIASPADASTTCTFISTPLLTAVPGTSVVSLFVGGVAAESTCTVSVDVVATGGGILNNISGELRSGSAPGVSSGTASATLDVTVDTLHLTKSFTDDPIPPGESATLEFTIENFDRNFSATSIAFTDDLTTIVPALAGLTFASLLSNDCGGTVSGVAGTTITFADGMLGPEGPKGSARSASVYRSPLGLRPTITSTRQTRSRPSSEARPLLATWRWTLCSSRPFRC